MLVERQVAAGHGADEIGFRNIADPAAFDPGAIAQHGIVIADLEDFLHLVTDEDDGVIAIQQSADDLENALDFDTRQR